MLIPLWNRTQASFLVVTPLLCSNVSGQPTECLLTECSRPIWQPGLSSNIRNFPTNFGCLRISSHMTTPPSNILPTNQDTLSHKGPSTSGHIQSRSVSQ
ncbi:hypothetical protein TNCV_2572051 [Trichonephila clavipes]|nr:hypothetical protein TNCV_2572051 [Trichonephila clavipes]